MTRNLDLLVLNQGHGGIGYFEDWSATDLLTYMVQPMVAAEISVNILVLDFCVSASLLGAFSPLLSDQGVLISTVYSTGAIVSTDIWRQLDAPLQRRDLFAIQTVLNSRMRALSAGITGLSHLEQVRGWSEVQTAQHLQAQPQDRDAVSIIRYLPQIADAVRRQSLAQAYADLVHLRQNPNVGGAERAIFDFLPPAANQYDAHANAVIQARLSDRVVAILTLAQYGLQRAVAGLQLFAGTPNLWEMVQHGREQLLAQATGLRRCPSPYVVYGADGGWLQLDAEFMRTPLDPAVSTLLGRIHPSAAQDAVQITQGLLSGPPVQVARPEVHFLQ
ncbi:hypothetical protein [Sphingomonas sp. S2-65]|uniref:hypothetical protein n=1 Tax=Sphingomonas sp. S2-65 TaxID=2903960 RepID=UPI001F2D27CE|nr:hypothetical protein [Sphingomonas sp. S2-65]UYY59376.1 hypothetical protein LZ586_04640 [Sphingomonas sp. S2-65]